jgi:hypothetical protein
MSQYVRRVAFVLAGAIVGVAAITWTSGRDTRAPWWLPGGFRYCVECQLEDWGIIPRDPFRHVVG